MTRWLQLLLVLLTLTVIGTFVATQLSATDGVLGAPLDDAWIHFQYARNLSQGNGFSYNPNQPTPGSTAPLWTLLLAIPAFFTADLLPFALGLSALCFLLSVKVTFDFAKSLTRNAVVATVAAASVAFTGRLAWASWSGMEATAFTALCTYAIHRYTKDGLTPLVAILLGVASQLRPEAHALFGLAGLLWLYDVAAPATRSFRQIMKTGALLVALYALMAAPYSLFSLATTGKPLPNTFYAKSSVDESWLHLNVLWGTLRLHFWDNPLLFVFIPFGLLPLWRRSRLAVLWLIGLPIFTALIVEIVWHHGRYTLPLVPIQAIAGTLGIGGVIRFTLAKITHLNASFLPQQRAKPLQRQLFAFVTLLVLATGYWNARRWATALATNTQEILAVDVAIGEWLAANTPPDALIAVDDIGAIAYLSGREIFDLNGLVSPEMWPILRNEAYGLPRNQATLRLLSEVQPDYLAIFPPWHFELATNGQVVEEVAQFSAETRTIIGNQEAIIYQTDWPYFVLPPSDELAVVFGEKIGLRDVAIEQLEGVIAIEFVWQGVGEISADYDLFIHLLDPTNNFVAQTDGQPLNFLAPTSRWQIGDTLRDRRTLPLNDMPAGNYSLNIGWYDRTTGVRLTTQEGQDVWQLGSITLP